VCVWQSRVAQLPWPLQLSSCPAWQPCWHSVSDCGYTHVGLVPSQRPPHDVPSLLQPARMTTPPVTTAPVTMPQLPAGARPEMPLHDWHCLSHLPSQHTPSTQKPE